MRSAEEMRLSIGEHNVMDETIRRDNSGDSYSHPTSKRGDLDRGDDMLLLFRRRDREQQTLTKREREERWPIG
jgi:hypothetical protein